MWVSNASSGNVTKLRSSDGTILGSYSAGGGPSGMVFDGSNIWIANVDSLNVTKLRASDGKHLGTFALPAQGGLCAFDGANVWITVSNGKVVKM
jgi:sugar lactone lactonase YvrE